MRWPERGQTATDQAALLRLLSDCSVVLLDTDAGGVDVHLRPPGAAPNEELRDRALVIEVAEVSVPIAGRDDLIAMKRAAGRPIDRGDVIALTSHDVGRGSQI